MANEFVSRNGIIAKNNVVVSGSLAVTGSAITLNGIGVLLNNQTASLSVNSASFASTASSADNFTVRGTLTAQTINVQTITSSIEFNTGSTKNGSLLTNTHEFTGSVSITGSLAIPGVSVGTSETNILVADTSGNIRFRSNLSLQGTTGAQGTNGSNGAQGTTGAQGTNGSNGAQGTTGAQGTNGTNGTQGTTGSQGTNGTNGSQGTAGTNGSQGTAGTNGSQGTTGSQGIQGRQGTSGTNGAQGTTGSTGTGTQGATGTSGATVDNTDRTLKSLRFTGVGGDSGNGALFDSYAIYQQGGGWSHPYPDLCIGYHTGIKIGAYYGYNGTRIYNNSDWATQIASFGDGDNNFRGYYDIIAYASDKRLKHNIESIENPLSKIISLKGMTYNWNEVGKEYGWDPGNEREVGVFAQDIQAVLPEAVKLAPFDQAHDENGNSYSKSGENFLTVKYEKLVPLLIEGIKEQQLQIEELKNRIFILENK